MHIFLSVVIVVGAGWHVLTANVQFGGADLKTLYIATRTSLYSVPMDVAGPRYPACQAL